MFKTMKYFWNEYSRHSLSKSFIAMLLVLLLFITGLELIPVFLQKKIFDTAIPSESILLLVYILLGLIISNLFVFACDLASDYFGTLAIEKAVYDRKIGFFKHLIRLRQSFFDTTALGNIFKLLGDIDAHRLICRFFTLDLLKNVTAFIIFLPILFFFSWKLTLVKIVAVPLSFLLSRFFVKRDLEYERLQWNENSRMTTFFSEAVQGIRIIKAFVSEDSTVKKMKHTSLKIRDIDIRRRVYSYAWSILNYLITNLSTAVIFFLAAIDIINGSMTFGTFIAFNMLSSILVRYMSQFFDSYKKIVQSYNSTQRLNAMNALPEEETSLKTYTKPSHRLNGKIEFRNVCFGYDPKVPVIKNLSLTVSPGQKIAFVGRSGAGKSTLVNLLLRFYEIDNGQLLFDNISINDMTPSYLRQNIGIVLQDNFFFNGTIRDNLTFRDRSIPDSQIFRALESAHAMDFIMELPQKIMTYYGAEGVDLSGGQKQRLAIARAFIQNPAILILDEATSALDLESEKIIQTALERLMKDRTTITIAHRLSTIQAADVICIIDKGSIIEQGNHEELINAKGLYYELYTKLGMLNI